MPTEDQLIERIAKLLPSLGSARGRSARGRRLGIGDDAAIIDSTRASEWVLSCDAFVEGTHFLADTHPAHSVGYKALARATSDLAAMGAAPRFFLLTLALPAGRTGKWLDDFLRGMARAARELGMSLAGGDTTKDRKVFVSVTVIGEIAPGRAILRSGACAGDRIYVSGTLGAAQLGLLMVKRDPHLAAKHRPSGRISPVRAHLYPQARVALGRWLARNRVASAMIDVSDGLSTDLARLCKASGVGARVWAGRIPCVEIPTGLPGRFSQALSRSKLDPLVLALDGGEDYELLFTVTPQKEKRLRRAPGFAELRQIGEIQAERRIELVERDGEARPLRAAGWDPFQS